MWRRAGALLVGATLLASGCSETDESPAQADDTTTTTTSATTIPTTTMTPTTTTTVAPPVELDVMLAGDSLSVGILPPMEAALDARECRTVDNVCAGLVFPEVQQRWSEIFTTDPPDLVVMLMATWENAGLRSENSPIDPVPDAPGWVDSYRAVVLDPWVAQAEAAGSQVIWVGMPQIRHMPTTIQHQQLNDVWRALADEHDSMVFVDGAAILAGPDGGYAEIDTTTNPAGRLFQLDGIHLCPDGAERLVEAVAAVTADRYGGSVNEGWADLDWRTDERAYEPGECPAPGGA